MRMVSFGIPEGARDALADERDVMRKFHSHVSRCGTCYENLNTWRHGEPLCSRGHGYVLDMKPYFFCKGGKPYSMIDREKRDERNRVFVPTEYRHVGTLFEAIDAGYKTGMSRQQHPRPKVVIHQPAIQVPEIVSPRRERRTLEPVILSPERYVVASSPRSPRSPRSYPREEHYYREPRRGSLFYEDQRRRYPQESEMIVSGPDRYYR